MALLNLWESCMTEHSDHVEIRPYFVHGRPEDFFSREGMSNGKPRPEWVRRSGVWGRGL